MRTSRIACESSEVLCASSSYQWPSMSSRLSGELGDCSVYVRAPTGSGEWSAAGWARTFVEDVARWYSAAARALSGGA